jgi:hypothetical protein
MAKGVNHYTRDGDVYRGETHKMSNGKLHTGIRHTTTSKPLFHYGQLTNKAKAKARISRKRK